mmetsp:Transcript_88700/g.246336  ORF Transcript_88700/g.246336 Transcript_88700/m.246336 type:complete len:214 (-) Transcript_88700:349-990(-)
MLSLPPSDSGRPSPSASADDGRLLVAAEELRALPLRALSPRGLSSRTLSSRMVSSWMLPLSRGWRSSGRSRTSRPRAGPERRPEGRGTLGGDAELECCSFRGAPSVGRRCSSCTVLRCRSKSRSSPRLSNVVFTARIRRSSEAFSCRMLRSVFRRWVSLSDPGRSPMSEPEAERVVDSRGPLPRGPPGPTLPREAPKSAAAGGGPRGSMPARP